MSRGDEKMWQDAVAKLEAEVAMLKRANAVFLDAYSEEKIEKLEAEVAKLKAENAMKKIIVKVGDYVISDVEGLPKGATLEIHNYDFPDEAEEEGLQMEVDNDGDQYEKVVWRQDG